MTVVPPLSRDAIEATQLAHLRKLLAALSTNRFYAPQLKAAKLNGTIDSLDAFTRAMPFTTKAQLAQDQCDHPPYGSNLTFDLERYTRYNQTSATTGVPMRWLDTPDSWQALLDVWKRVFDAADVTTTDRIFFAFSFGPFLGFWTAFEAATQLGALAIPGGGMSSAARLAAILDNHATVLCCTPTYAIRLAEVAAQDNIDLTRSTVRRIIVAGEPGGSVPATRQRIEQAWPNARVVDHHGMTEVGPVSYENPHHRGILHIVEDAFLPELIDPHTLEPLDWTSAAADGESLMGELVLTTLRRIGSPLLRYRTGDLVRISSRPAAELNTAEMPLDGGILGRADDMVVVRGVNVYPSAIDQIIRSDDAVAEYRVEVASQRGMTELAITVEPVATCNDGTELCQRLEQALRRSLQLRIPVQLGADLPRFEMKAKRWIRQTNP